MSSVETLWKDYKGTGSKVAKDKLLVEYSHLVKFISHRLSINLPASVDKNDLTSAGILGLIKAVETFEPERGFKFETYAAHKIRGTGCPGRSGRKRATFSGPTQNWKTI
jgi:RNA polymerase sigma factor for flagellar operon FliA